MSFRDEFKVMNAWEWSAAGLACLVLAYYIYAGFPLIAAGCLVAAVFCAVMALIRRKRKAGGAILNTVRERRFIIFRFKR